MSEKVFTVEEWQAAMLRAETAADKARAVKHLVAAAEERGRRRGIASAQLAVDAVVAVCDRQQDVQCRNGALMAAEAVRKLAPRDSAPECDCEQRYGRGHAPRLQGDVPMTPPDSGSDSGYDSGEREVIPPTARGMCLHTTSGRHRPTSVCSACGISLASLVALDPDLAQRILAALELNPLDHFSFFARKELVDELRAIVERKT